MNNLAAAQALSKLFEQIPDVDKCDLGAPLDPGPGDSFILLEWDTDYALNESGGSSDDTTILTIVSVIGELGKPDAALELAGKIDDRVNRFKQLLEADVTLKNAVSQAKLKKSTVQTVPSGENAWEAGCRIEVEVQEW